MTKCCKCFFCCPNFAKQNVWYLFLVGSILRPSEFREDSDIDFVFAFDEAAIPDKLYNPNLFRFWDGLEEILGRKVDLIHGPSLKNPYLIRNLNRTKRLVYDGKGTEISLGYYS